MTKNCYGLLNCANPVTIMRKTDYLCMPRNRANLKEAWEWAKEKFSFEENQVYYYDNFETEEEEENSIIDILEYFKPLNIAVFPNQTNLILNSVAEKMKVKVMNDNIFTYPDKRWLHPTIPRSKHSSQIFGIDFPKGVKVAKGYTCYNVEELREAKLLMEMDRVTKMLIKDVYTSGGDNIFFFNTEEEFEQILSRLQFELRPDFKTETAYIIEELIEASLCKNGNILTPTAHYLGNQMLPGIYNQNIKNYRYQGITNDEPDPEISKKCTDQAELLSRALNLNGPWGIDYIIDKNGEPYLLDVNLGRICGSHYFRMFMNLHVTQPNKSFISSKCGNFTKTITDIEKELRDNKINFNFETQRGIIFMRIYEQNSTASFIIGDSKEDVQFLEQELKKMKL